MDRENTLDFLLQQQAKFFAGLEEMRAQQAGINQQQAQINQQQAQINQQQAQINQQQGQINMSLGKALLGLTDHVDKLIAAQSHTDERLNALIAVVDGLVHRPPTAPQ